jgi:hypothetical protein
VRGEFKGVMEEFTSGVDEKKGYRARNVVRRVLIDLKGFKTDSTSQRKS